MRLFYFNAWSEIATVEETERTFFFLWVYWSNIYFFLLNLEIKWGWRLNKNISQDQIYAIEWLIVRFQIVLTTYLFIRCLRRPANFTGRNSNIGKASNLGAVEPESIPGLVLPKTLKETVVTLSLCVCHWQGIATNAWPVPVQGSDEAPYLPSVSFLLCRNIILLNNENLLSRTLNP